MDRSSVESEARFLAYVEGLASVIGHADRNGPLRDYCTGAPPAGRAQERGAHGGDDCAGTHLSAAPVDAA
jgi:hypothetical protein